MQHCAEERRKLAAEWTHFHAHEKQRHERAEREVGSLLEKREGSILGLAQVSVTGGKRGMTQFLYYTKRIIIHKPLIQLLFLECTGPQSAKTFVFLLQEQANLKLLTADVRQKEKAAAQERDTLERLRDELDREKDKISSTGLRLKTRAQEVEAFSKVNSHHTHTHLCK